MTTHVRARRRTLMWLGAAAVVCVVGTLLFALSARRRTPDVPMVDVARSEFVDVVELRGEVRPIASRVLTAPTLAGDLQIIKLAKANAAVKAGDVLVEFDPTTLQRTRQERLSELRQADAEIDQARADAHIVDEQNRTALTKARFDVERAALDVIEGDLVARLDYERAKLGLEDAKQRLKETEAKNRAAEASNAANLAAKARRRQKVQADLERAEQGLAGLQLRAPSDGVVSLLLNYRTGGVMSGGQEFREGDRAWSGAGIVELPDVASVRIAARLEHYELRDQQLEMADAVAAARHEVRLSAGEEEARQLLLETAQAAGLSGVELPALAESFAARAADILGRPFVEAARTAGAGGPWLLRYHVLPFAFTDWLESLPVQALSVAALVGKLGVLRIFIGGTILTIDPVIFLPAKGEWLGLLGYYYTGVRGQPWLFLAPFAGWMLILTCVGLLSSGMKTAWARSRRILSSS